MDDQAEQALGRFQSLRKGVLAACIVCLFGASLFVGSALEPDTGHHDAIVLLGQTMIFAGILGRLWSTLYIGGRKKMLLVVDGPYSVSRNPLYFFSTVAAAGVGALTGSISIMIGFGAFCLAAFWVVTLREEQFLKSLIGDAYEVYLGQVPRFWPQPSSYRGVENLSVQPRLLKKTLFDSLGFLVPVPLFKIVEYAQTAGILPILLRLP